MLPKHVIGDAFTSDYRWRAFEALTDVGNRMPGSDGERRASAIMHDTFDEVSFQGISITEFDIPCWKRESTSLEVSEPIDRSFVGDHEVLTLLGSPSATIRSEIVDVGGGLPEDFRMSSVEGKIVQVSSQNRADYGRAVNRIEKYVLAEDAGAAGVIYYNDAPGSITPIGAVGFGSDSVGTIPAVGVSREVSRRLLRWNRRKPITVTLDIEATHFRGTSRNFEATVRPNVNEEVLVTSHIDSHDVADGAQDNAAGCALTLEVGRLLSMVPDLSCKVRLIGFGSEEVSLYGSSH